MINPKIRFQFSDDWKKCLVSDILIERKERRKISNDIPLLAFAAGQGVIDLSERKTNNRDFLTADQSKKTYLYTKIDDIVYNPANLKFGAIDRNKHGQGVISPIYVTFTTNENPKFVEYLVKTEKFKRKALQYEQGTVVKRKSVNPCDLIRISISIPNSQEQNKIGDFFELLDKRINLQIKKVEYLKIYQNKLFDILMDSIDGHKKLGNLAVLKNGYAFKNSKYDKNGKYNILTISNVSGDKYICSNFKNKYAEIPNNIQPHQLLKEDDILVSLTGNVGRVSYNIGKNNLLNQRVGLIDVNKNVNKKYIFYVLNNKKFERAMINCGQGAAQLNISKSDVENYIIPYPSIEKQEKIVSILDCFSTKLQLETEKMDKLVDIKKGLMQNMFV